jgi:hypothetical protein
MTIDTLIFVSLYQLELDQFRHISIEKKRAVAEN